MSNLFTDLRDGVFLCHLVEVLTGDALVCLRVVLKAQILSFYYAFQPVNKTHFSKRVHHISNLTTVLSVLRSRGLELVNNNPTDLADGNPHIVLGLIWQIILHFQVETAIELVSECYSFGGVKSADCCNQVASGCERAN